jgi:hypothetical protein
VSVAHWITRSLLRLACVVYSSLLPAWRIKRKIMFVQFFSTLYVTVYLRYGWSINLWAIENCIFGIRSTERKTRPTLLTCTRP